MAKFIPKETSFHVARVANTNIPHQLNSTIEESPEARTLREEPSHYRGSSSNRCGEGKEEENRVRIDMPGSHTQSTVTPPIVHDAG